MSQDTLTPNQVVAYNLIRARRLRGWTQEEAGRRLGPYLGTEWSKALFSGAERSIDGVRVRPFDADELVAFSRAFDLPVLWFLLPPPTGPDEAPPAIGLSEGRGHVELAAPLSAAELIELVAGTDVSEFVVAIGSRLDELPEDTRTPAQRVLAELAGKTLLAALGEDSGRVLREAEHLRELAAFLEQAINAQYKQMAAGLPKVDVDV